MPFEEQINFMLHAIASNQIGLETSTGATQTQYALKNQMLATSLIRSRKVLGLQKSVA